MGGLKKDGKVVHGTPKGDKTYSDPQLPIREEKYLEREEEKTLKEKSFTPLKDSQGTKDRVKELARRSKVGIEQGQEELERSGSQSKIGSEVVTDRRAAAAASATSGIQGVTQANKLLQADVAGMAKTAAFEGDLASRDFAAKEDAGEKLSALQVDLKQDEIETSAKNLAFNTTQDNHETTMLNNWMQTFAEQNGGRQPTQEEINTYKTTMGLGVTENEKFIAEDESVIKENAEYNAKLKNTPIRTYTSFKPGRDELFPDLTLTQLEEWKALAEKDPKGAALGISQLGTWEKFWASVEHYYDEAMGFMKTSESMNIVNETTEEDGTVVYTGIA